MLNQDFKVFVHPIVPLSIMNLYSRDIRQRKVGSLFGFIHLSHVEVTSIHPILELNNEKSFQLDMDGHRQACQHRRKTGSSESVIGAFITSSNAEMNELPYIFTLYSDAKNGFVSQGCLTRPIVLLLDPSNPSLPLKAYFYSNPLKLPTKFQATGFDQLSVTVSFSKEEPRHVLPLLNFMGDQKIDFSRSASIKTHCKQLLQEMRNRVVRMRDGIEPVNEALLISLGEACTEAEQAAELDVSVLQKVLSVTKEIYA